MNAFHYTAYAQEIIFGVGSVARLSDAAAAYGWERLLLVTSPSQRGNGVAATVEAALGSRLAATYDRVRQHVQESQVAEALHLADECRADAVIGLGGGSPIGMAKAVCMALEARRAGVETAHARYPTEQPAVPGIAIPTTYAGSEMTPIYGVTHIMDDGSARKITVRDDKVTPKLVIYDPLLTLALPPDVTAATGINALAHCIESLYSITRNPFSTASALLGIEYIRQSLLRCYRHGDDLDARTQMMMGANLGGQSIASVALGVHHGTCHVLGGTAGVPHGVANSIMLPHAIRFNLDAVAPLIAQAGRPMGVRLENKSDEQIGEQVARAVYDLVGQMGLPQRLRDAGVAEDMLPQLAENMLKTRSVIDNPKPVTSVEQAMGLLRAAW